MSDGFEGWDFDPRDAQLEPREALARITDGLYWDELQESTGGGWMSGWKTYLAGGIFIAGAAWKAFGEGDWEAAYQLFGLGLGIIGGRHVVGRIEVKLNALAAK